MFYITCKVFEFDVSLFPHAVHDNNASIATVSHPRPLVSDSSSFPILTNRYIKVKERQRKKGKTPTPMKIVSRNVIGSIVQYWSNQKLSRAGLKV